MDIVQWPTKNFGYPRGTHGRNGEQIVGLCDHIMQGWITGYHSYLADPTKNSATFSVYRDGHVEQHVPFEDAAWCNGPMADPDLSVPFIKRCWEKHINPNLVTVSIEHEGLTGVAWPEAQILASIELHKYILSKCPGILPDRQHIVGHYQIDSVNKSTCPGSAFPWVRVMNALVPPIDPAYLLVGDGLRKWLLAHPEVGKPRFKSTFDGHGAEMVWCTPSATYKDGPLVIWRGWAADLGKDPVVVATWRDRIG